MTRAGGRWATRASTALGAVVAAAVVAGCGAAPVSQSVPEAGRLQGVPASTARGRYQRAKDALRDSLGDGPRARAGDVALGGVG